MPKQTTNSAESEEEKAERIKDLTIRNFEGYLRRQNLAASTIKKHGQNAYDYLDFLYFAEGLETLEELSSEYISDFIEHDCIRGLTPSQSALQTMTASLKKFYVFLEEKGRVSRGTAQGVSDLIKSGLPYWQARLYRYYHDDDDDEDGIWGLF